MERLMPIISGSLDALLGIVCLYLCQAFARAGNDFLAHGFAWISSAALVGGLKLGGFSAFADTHSFLTDVSKGPGMLFLSLGIIAAIFGAGGIARWSAPILSAAGVGLVVFFLGTLAAGGHVVEMEKFDALRALDRSRHRGPGIYQ